MNSIKKAMVAQNKAHQGFTVVELLIVLSVISAIFLVGSPAVSYLAQQRYLKSTTDDLVTSINMAQEEADKRYSTVRMCPSSGGTACRTDGDWNRGWLVFSDGNNNHVPDRIELLKYFGPPKKNIQVKADGAFRQIASFNVAGVVSANDSKVGSFSVCNLGTVSGSSTLIMGEDGFLEVKKSDDTCKIR